MSPEAQAFMEITLTPFNQYDVEDLINAAVHEGKQVVVNGVRVQRRWARYTSGVAETWFKAGDLLRITIVG